MQDWSLDYAPYQYEGTSFNISLTIAPNVPLPTTPDIRIVGVKGGQRIDHDIEVNLNDNITFYQETAATTADPPNCDIGDPRCITGGNALHLGDLGLTSNGNLNSGATAQISADIGDTLVLTIPAYNVTGVHGFAVLFWNGISSVKHHPDTLEPEDEEIQMLDPSPQGTGEWVTVSVIKWDYNWVEVYRPFEGTVQAEFSYTVPEWPTDVEAAEFVEDKFYMPASARPHIDLDLYKGNVRRIQYMFNNTEAGEYQPPPCFVDWPVPDTFLPTQQWAISHCGNLSEGTYQVVASVWNPLDGWKSSQEATIKILERFGPVYIDDYSIVTDHVSRRPDETKLDLKTPISTFSSRTRPSVSTSRSTTPGPRPAWSSTGATAPGRSSSATPTAAR